MKAVEFIIEKAGGRFIFGRGGKPGGSHKGKVTRKFRCVSGPRKGRIVAKMSTCHAPIDVKKKKTMTVTRAKAPKLAAKKSMFTKKGSGISRAVMSKNKAKTAKTPKRKK
jgi:hypothetical protein